ncbi:MAG: hypothetical protein OXP12_00385 [Thaumarchaeota archaeon]|nr:hypothetical protein [Nitrososphaerota archaeon]
MDFGEFWAGLSLELKTRREFRTLKRSKTFEVRMADPWTVTVTPSSTRMSRGVRMNEFQQMWDIMKDDIRSERYVNSDGRYSEFWNPSYVNALIDHVVGDQDMQ